MKRYCCGVILLLAFLVALSGCEKKRLPQPAFPLEAATITSALEEANLPWVITDEQSWYEGHTNYTLCDEKGQAVADVSSESVDGRRSLIVGFRSPASEFPVNSAPISERDWEKAFQFATSLYGGVENNTQVFKAFSKDEPNESTENQDISMWERKLDDISCFARVVQVTSGSSAGKYLKGIEFYNPEGLAYHQALMDKIPQSSSST